MNRRLFLQSGLGSGLALGLPAIITSGPARGQGGGALDDLSIIRQALTALHPGLHRYLSPRQLEQQLAVLARQWAADPTLEGRFLALSRMLATVRCGHTHINPYNQSEGVEASLLKRATRLPFRFAWIDRQMVVLTDLTGDDRLPPGSIVERINGVPTPVMLARLLAYARADGSNDGKRIALMEVSGIDRFETFDIFQALLFPPRDGAFALSVRLPDGRRQRMSVAAQDDAARLAQRTAPDTAGDDLCGNGRCTTRSQC